MADKFLSKVNLSGEDYLLKDAEARTRLTTAEGLISGLEASKQDVIDADNKLAAAYVSLTKPEGTKLTSTDVQAAVYELEAAIETGGTGSIVNVVKKETAESGYFATYEITQGGTKVGASINIPRDYLVKSAELKTVTKADEPYTGAKVGDKYIDFVVNVKEGTEDESHIYLPVNELVDAYTADETTLHMANNQFSVKAVPMNLVTGLDTALNAKADDADLQAEIERAEAAEAEKLAIDDAGEFAYVDKGTATVAQKTVSGVVGTATVAGNVTVELQDAAAIAAEITAKAAYKPAGTIAAADGGSFSALKTATFGADNNGVQIGGTNADSAVTVDSSNATVLGSVKTAAVAPSFTDNKIGTFVAPQLTIAESDSFAKAGLVATVDDSDECLTLTAASTGKASVCSGWNAGSWTQGTFNAGSAAEFENATVIGSISGGTAAAQVFTGNKYSVATTADTALKNVVFEGTETANLIPTEIKYVKPEIKSASFAQTSGTIAVDDIVVPSQTIEVTPAE